MYELQIGSKLTETWHCERRTAKKAPTLPSSCWWCNLSCLYISGYSSWFWGVDRITQLGFTPCFHEAFLLILVHSFMFPYEFKLWWKYAQNPLKCIVQDDCTVSSVKAYCSMHYKLNTHYQKAGLRQLLTSAKYNLRWRIRPCHHYFNNRNNQKYRGNRWTLKMFSYRFHRN